MKSLFLLKKQHAEIAQET